LAGVDDYYYPVDFLWLAYVEAEPRAAFRVIVAGQGKKVDALAAGEFDPLSLLEKRCHALGLAFYQCRAARYPRPES